MEYLEKGNALKERSLMNLLEQLSNKVIELENLIGISSKILRQLERTENSGNLVESGRESKPMDKQDVIAVIDVYSDRISDVINRVGKNLEQVLKMIG